MNSKILQEMPTNDFIVRYYERFIDKANTTLHIVMEYCESGDLTQVIRRHRDDHLLVPEDLVWSYLAQLCLALADCHSEVSRYGKPKNLILHRDIKPENVFLKSDQTIKLGDFGLSKAMAAAAFTSTYVGVRSSSVSLYQANPRYRHPIICLQNSSTASNTTSSPMFGL